MLFPVVNILKCVVTR